MKLIKQIFYLLPALMMVTTAALAVPAIPVMTWTASWTDAQGVARTSTVNASNEAYVGNKASFTLSETVSDAAWIETVQTLPSFWHFYGCIGSNQDGTCWQSYQYQDTLGAIESIPTGYRLSATFQPTNSSVERFNLTLGVRTISGTWDIRYSTDLKIYGQPTTTERDRIFAYARSLFPTLDEVKTIIIDGNGSGAGEYQYVNTPDNRLAIGINAADGQVWWYDGEFHTYASWWATLAEAQARGF